MVDLGQKRWIFSTFFICIKSGWRAGLQTLIAIETSSKYTLKNRAKTQREPFLQSQVFHLFWAPPKGFILQGLLRN